MVKCSIKSSSSSAPKVFPAKVLQMLSVDEAVAGWFPHGRAIKVHDKRRFLRDIAPIFFKVSKFRSFTRQLHLWGFRRISSGVDEDGWWHPHFLRGRPDLMSKMVRIKIKGKGIGNREHVEAPNFYDMPYPDSDGESTATTSDEAPSSPVNRARNKSTTPPSEGCEELDYYLRGGRKLICPRSASVIKVDPHNAPSIPRLPYKKPMKSRQTVAHVPAFRSLNFSGPSINASRETHEFGTESNSIFEPIPFEPIPLPVISSNTFRPIQEEEEEEFKAFIGRTIKFL